MFLLSTVLLRIRVFYIIVYNQNIYYKNPNIFTILYIWYKMLFLSLNTMFMLSKTTLPTLSRGNFHETLCMKLFLIYIVSILKEKMFKLNASIKKRQNFLQASMFNNSNIILTKSFNIFL